MSWLLVFLGLCLLIILHEAGHFTAAKLTGMPVERFFLFFGPTIWSFKRGETEYGIKSIPLGGYVKINGMNPEEDLPPGTEDRAYYKQPVWKRIFVIAAGPAVNIVLAFVIFFFIFLYNSPQATQNVGEVIAKSPAVGVLEKGDEIVAVDGKRFPEAGGVSQRTDEFRKQIGTHECAGTQKDGCLASPVRLTVVRDGEAQVVTVRPEYKAEAKQALVGFGFESKLVDGTPSEALRHSADTVWAVASGTAHVFSHIFESQERKEISGIVGTSSVANEAVNTGLVNAFLILGLVSLSLGLINLLPILPLDGGHIFWSVIEKLRGGRAVSLRTMERATVIGFALVAVLMVIGLSNDIGRLTGEGFKVR